MQEKLAKICKTYIPGLVILAILFSAVYILITGRDISHIFRENYSGSQVRIYTSKACGTGTIIEDNDTEILIVANLHLLIDWDENGYVVFADGQQAFGQIYGGDEDLDICFLSVPKVDITKKLGRKVKPAHIRYTVDSENKDKDKILSATVEDNDKDVMSGTGKESNKDEIMAGSDIYVYNLYADSKRPKQVWGKVVEASTYIYDIDKVLMLCKCEVESGMSGAGVFDEAGNLLGIVVGGSAENDMVAAPIDDIMKLK